MKQFAIIIAFFVLLCARAGSQGFDWQYSARLPFETPRFFIGIAGNADFTYSIAELPLLENSYRQCCNFNDGTGFAGAVGLNFEYWQRGYSIFAKFMYGYYESYFSAKGESYPIRGGGELTSEYKATTHMQRVTVEPGARYRLFGSHFSLDASLKSSVIVKFTYDRSDSEAIVGDTYNPEIPDYNIFYLQFNLGMSFDFSVGLGKYSTINVFAGLPLTGISKTGKWLPVSIGAGFTYNNGL